MQLKEVYSKYFPFRGYIALTFCPWIFIRKDLKSKYIEKSRRHETTHALQQLETLWLFFLIIYCLEYIIKYPLCGFHHKKAYRSISFEQEARGSESKESYNTTRRPYVWLKYIFTIKK